MSFKKWLCLVAAAAFALSTQTLLAQGEGHGHGRGHEKHADRDDDRRDDRGGDWDEHHSYREHDRELHGIAGTTIIFPPDWQNVMCCRLGWSVS